MGGARGVMLRGRVSNMISGDIQLEASIACIGGASLWFRYRSFYEPTDARADVLSLGRS